MIVERPVNVQPEIGVSLYVVAQCKVRRKALSSDCPTFRPLHMLFQFATRFEGVRCCLSGRVPSRRLLARPREHLIVASHDPSPNLASDATVPIESGSMFQNIT
jgi:hypothetical protein